MLFNSLEFIAFYLAVCGIYFLLPFRGQNLLMLGASYFFYGCWDWRFLGLIWFSSSMDYFLALRLYKSRCSSRRRLLLAVSVVVNMGILFTFKYFGFFAENLSLLLNALGWTTNHTMLNVLLPVGISFYTFQTMSYIVDVYRGHVDPTRRYTDYLLFVSFFPQLVAGPIERAQNLLRQVTQARDITWSKMREGAWLILFGFYKKVVVADNLAPFVNEVFNNPEDARGLAVLVGLLAFCFQIYGDFSGYSDIARGTARILGFELSANFRMPYFSKNPSEFWQRWHITLSSWLRDYVYIPLGGNRVGRLLTCRNLIITMLLGGLWHGAAWNFVLWGAFHGFLLVGYRVADGMWKRPGFQSAFQRYVSVFIFFLFTCLGWLLFRVNELSDVELLWRGLWIGWQLNGLVCIATIIYVITPMIVIELIQEKKGSLFAVKQLPAYARVSIYATLWAGILFSGAVETQEFIYFQF